jgi:hypothetical protein
VTKRPDSVKVGPFVFNIVWNGAELRRLDRIDGRDSFGMTLMDRHRIVIEDARPLSALQNTLLHEILHALVWTYDVPMPYQDDEHKMEEAFVCRFDSPFLLLMKDNPEVFAWLLTEDEHA